MYIQINNELNNKYYINTNGTIFYIYNEENNTINTNFADTFGATKMEVIKLNKKTNTEIEVEETLKEILTDNNFIQTVQVISSTIKPTGYFEERDGGMKYCYLNIFLGSITFKEAQEFNKYSNNNVIELLRTETPIINHLFRNLFYNESDEIICNFMRWLKNVAYADKRQDIIWLFKGTDEINEGQGAGKGVIQSLLTKMFNGLVTSVSNDTYADKFNANLQNKKIVIFDELEFQRLKYSVLKNITGSPYIRVEAKNKDALQVPNVSSWLLFTNEWDLKKVIQRNDRRTFIICPNPHNDSLNIYVSSNFEDFDSFQEALFAEINNLIHILSNVEGKVLSPIELISNAKIEYFQKISKSTVDEIVYFYKIFTNQDMADKVVNIIKEIEEFNPNIKQRVKTIIDFINLKCMNMKVFGDLFNILKDNGLIKNSLTIRKEWERLKDKLLEMNWIQKSISLKKTKIYKSHSEKAFLMLNDLTKMERAKVNKSLRYLSTYG